MALSCDKCPIQLTCWMEYGHQTEVTAAIRRCYQCQRLIIRSTNAAHPAVFPAFWGYHIVNCGVPEMMSVPLTTHTKGYSVNNSQADWRCPVCHFSEWSAEHFIAVPSIDYIPLDGAVPEAYIVSQDSPPDYFFVFIPPVGAKLATIRITPSL